MRRLDCSTGLMRATDLGPRMGRGLYQAFGELLARGLYNYVVSNLVKRYKALSTNKWV